MYISNVLCAFSGGWCCWSQHYTWVAQGPPVVWIPAFCLTFPTALFLSHCTSQPLIIPQASQPHTCPPPPSAFAPNDPPLQNFPFFSCWWLPSTAEEVNGSQARFTSSLSNLCTSYSWCLLCKIVRRNV